MVAQHLKNVEKYRAFEAHLEAEVHQYFFAFMIPSTKEVVLLVHVFLHLEC